MKAEHRKELETNTLADKMGRVVQQVKGGTRKTVLTYSVVALALIAVAWIGFRWYITDRQEASWRWAKFYDGARGDVNALAGLQDGSEVSKAAKFQLTWFMYWDVGVKALGSDAVGGIASIREAQKRYEKLAEECKDDQIFHPQALLGQAVAVETLAVQDNENLDKAKKLYEDLVTGHDGKYKESAEGKFAQERLKQLKENNGAELRKEYQNLRALLRVPLRQDPHQGLNLPPLEALKK